jgi:5-methylcytosine-specific restriction endonuclease McrA
MLLRDSEIAKQVRTYLLNVEENTDISSKLLALSTESINKINIMDSRLIRLENVTNTLESLTEEQRHLNNMIIDKLNELLEQPLFKINENMSNAYDNLVLIEFANTMRLYGNPASKFSAFNKAFENWVGLSDNRLNNKKQYNIYHYGIEIVRQFILGVKQGIIKKNEYGNWISLSGIYSNKIEWQKLLDEFDHKCAYCDGKEFEVVLMADHLIPQSSNGSTDIYYNLVPCCSDCNDSKKNKKTREWFREQDFYTFEKEEKLSNHWEQFYIQH